MLGRKTKMEIRSLKELQVSICLSEPRFLPSTDELAWLHGAELIIETCWDKESPKARQSSLRVPSFPDAAWTTDTFLGPTLPLYLPTRNHPGMNFFPVGKCTSGGRQLSKELIRPGQISQDSSVIELFSQISLLSKHTSKSPCR